MYINIRICIFRTLQDLLQYGLLAIQRFVYGSIFPAGGKNGKYLLGQPGLEADIERNTSLQRFISSTLLTQIINKERDEGMYRLSTYFFSKTVAESPLKLLLPSVYLVIVYWMANLNPDFSRFLGVLATQLLGVFAGESIGLFIGTGMGGVLEYISRMVTLDKNLPLSSVSCVDNSFHLISAAFGDMETQLVVATVGMLGLMLLGGFFVEDVPRFLDWAKYLSIFKYARDASLIFEFRKTTVRAQ